MRFPVDDAAMMMSIALRFMPTTAEEAERIIVAQTARGAVFDRGGLIQRAKAWVPVLIPLFVRLFRSLDALWGHEGTARAWLEGYNTALGAAPLDLIKSAAGLVRVVDYLDHARGRV